MLTAISSARALVTSRLIKGRCFIKGRVCLNHDETIQIDFETSSRLQSIDSFIAHVRLSMDEIRLSELMILKPGYPTNT